MSEVTDAERGLPPHGTSVQSSESPGRQPGRDTVRRLASPLWPPLILFVLCATAQVVRAAGWVHANFGAFSFLDELLYKRDAESILQGLPYFSFHYPPLYPLVLSAAFIFRTHWYLAMLLINAVVSSTVIFPVWAISRRFLTTRQSWLVAAVILLLPYGFAYPPVLWSENLFIPLLCLAVCLGFCADLDRPGAGYLYGLTVAALWATRSIAVVLVPVFAGLWFWRTHQREGRGIGLPHKRTMAGFAVWTRFLVGHCLDPRCRKLSVVPAPTSRSCPDSGPRSLVFRHRIDPVELRDRSSPPHRRTWNGRSTCAYPDPHVAKDEH
ncbi:MAG: hypothetical protein P8020_15325 [Acidobacteriota bacterium]